MAEPIAEATPAAVAEATAVPEAVLPPAPALEMPPAPSELERARPPVPSPPPPPAVAPVLAEEEWRAPTVEPQQAVMAVRRRLRRWRAFALLMTLVVAAVAALVAAWRFAPDRVPPALRPLALMRQVGVIPPAPPPRRPAPPQSLFEE
jgi:hypothetical protein